MVRACALSSRRGRQLSVHPYISMVGNTEVSTLWSKGCFLRNWQTTFVPTVEFSRRAAGTLFSTA